MADFYNLQRKVPVESGYDLVVAGGGPAGAAAAICAARLGINVLLIEATGCMGGMGTSGLVAAFDPMANGERMLVGGFMREIVETMYERGYLRDGIDPNIWRKHFHRWTPFPPERLKLLLDEFAMDAGVEIRYYTRVIDVDADAHKGQVNGVIIHNIEGYRYIEAKTFIDATGDAVLADLCQVPCREAGRDTPGIMPATLASLHSGIEWDRFDHEPDMNQDILQRAIADGHFSQPDRHLPGLYWISGLIGYLNGGHLYNMNALRVKDLTDGVMLGRKLAYEYVEFYRKYVPGCEKMELFTTATLMGVRESRRIVGEYELNIDDYMARREFSDQIGVFNKFVDIHPYDNSDEEYERLMNEAFRDLRLDPGEYFGIPYGILVPKGWQNLWVAGRCASSDVKVHGSIRVQPAASMMGQAAGTAAAQCLQTGQVANQLDTERLVMTLRESGAYLPQATLSRSMTRTIGTA